MKKFLALVLTLSSFSVFAQCYTFIEGGPQAIGGSRFREYSLTKMCRDSGRTKEFLTFYNLREKVIKYEVVVNSKRLAENEELTLISGELSNGFPVAFATDPEVTIFGQVQHDSSGAFNYITIEGKSYKGYRY